MLKQGDLLAERYLIEAIAGKGGMGVVYEASDTVLRGERVAVKVLNPKLGHDEKNTRRFLQEAQLTRKINHPNVVRTFEVGQSGDMFFLVMELIKGESLRSLLEDGPIDAEMTVQILIEVCLGLEAIHSAGIIHRDLTPANIIIMESGGVRITDFGIARGSQSTLTEQHELVGAGPYIAPENWAGKELDPRTDLYSLGVAAYEMLTGLCPFEGETPAELMYKHLEVIPAPLSVFVDNINPRLQQIVHRMLSKDPNDRPATATALADELEELLRKEGAYSSLDQPDDQITLSMLTQPPAGEEVILTPKDHQAATLSEYTDKPSNTKSTAENLSPAQEDRAKGQSTPAADEFPDPAHSTPEEFFSGLLVRAPFAGGLALILGALLLPLGSMLINNYMSMYALSGSGSAMGSLNILVALLYYAALGSLPLLFFCLCAEFGFRSLWLWLRAVGLLALSGLLFVLLALPVLYLHFRSWIDSPNFNLLLSRSMPGAVEAASTYLLEAGLLAPLETYYHLQIAMSASVISSSESLSWGAVLVYALSTTTVLAIIAKTLADAFQLLWNFEEIVLRLVAPIALLLLVESLLLAGLRHLLPELAQTVIAFTVGPFAFELSLPAAMCCAVNLILFFALTVYWRSNYNQIDD